MVVSSMAVSSGPVVLPDPVHKGLFDSIDKASLHCRNTWVIFIIATLVIFVLLGGITDKDFIVSTSIYIPIVGGDVPIQIYSFFKWAPLIYLLLYLNLLLTHKTLYFKVLFLDRQLNDKRRADERRYQVPAYFFAQLIAGPTYSNVFRCLLGIITFVSLVIVPLCIFLAFQIKFIPYHDIRVTWLHRVLSFVAMGSMWLFISMTKGAHGKNGGGKKDKPIKLWISLPAALLSVFFIAASLVNTVPCEGIEWWIAYIFRDSGQWQKQCAPSVNGELVKYRRILLDRWLPKNTIDVSVVNLEVYSTKVNKSSPDQPIPIDLRGRDLNFADFGQAKLTNAYLFGAKLRGANLREAKLAGVHLSCGYKDSPPSDKTSCTRVNDITLQGADLSGADLRDVVFQGSDLRSINFTGAKLDGIKIEDSRLNRARFDGASMKKAKISNSCADGARFDEVDLEGATFTNIRGRISYRLSNLQKAVFEKPGNLGCDKKEEDDDEVREIDKKFRICDKSEGCYDFAGADLTGASFAGDLGRSSFAGADLTGVIFTGIKSNGLKFVAANLEETKFVDSDLSSAQFDGAECNGAQLSSTTVTNAESSSTCLSKLRISPPLQNQEVPPKFVRLEDAPYKDKNSARQGAINAICGALGIVASTEATEKFKSGNLKLSEVCPIREEGYRTGGYERQPIMVEREKAYAERIEHLAQAYDGH